MVSIPEVGIETQKKHMSNHYQNITLLITHFNRSNSLEKLLHRFEQLDFRFGDIIVSDDASKEEHIRHLLYLKEQYAFKLISTPRNQGLGHNINKGQQAVNTDYTLYVQEDFQPTDAFSRVFPDAVDIMDKDTTLDLINFYAYEKYPYTKPYGNGFSEKIYRSMPWYSNHLKFYLYSDHPHLRRTSFAAKFGRYPEGMNGDKTEMQMSLSFIKNKGRALVYDRFYELFTQENTLAEPSTADFRKDWRNRPNWVVKSLRYVYLKWKVLSHSVQLILFKNPSTNNQ